MPKLVDYKTTEYVFQESLMHFYNIAVPFKDLREQFLSNNALRSHSKTVEYSCQEGLEQVHNIHSKSMLAKDAFW